jgi:hypothetical protein
MSALRKSGMVEGKPGETGNLTAKTSVFLRQTGRFCCVTLARIFGLASFTRCGACR